MVRSFKHRGLKALFDGKTARRVAPRARMLKNVAIFLRYWTAAVGLMR